MGTITVWHSDETSTDWLRRGRPNRSGGLGAVMPDATNTGPRPGVTLTEYTGNYTSQYSGQIISGRWQHGTITVVHPDVTITDCIVGGLQYDTGETWSACINLLNGNAINPVIQYTRVYPDFPSKQSTGIYGNKSFITRRCDVGHVVDCIGVQGGTHRDEGSWLHDLVYYRGLTQTHQSDPLPEGPHTHNDCIQYFGGSGHQLIGTRLSSYQSSRFGSFDNPRSGGQAGSCMQITGQGGFIVEDCWFEGGTLPVNAGAAQNGGLNLGRFHRNKFNGDSTELSNGLPAFLWYYRTATIDAGAGTVNANRYYTVPGKSWSGAECVAKAM